MALRVCIIDDDDLSRAHVAQTLATAGCSVSEAPNARRGLDLIAASPPDVALVDLIMPDMDGMEAIAEIRSRWPAVRVVAMSGGGRIGPGPFLEVALRVGACACLTKPLDLASFLAAVAEPPN
jgi:CheY-like chemotaxis protein